jgi:hypothetical protein
MIRTKMMGVRLMAVCHRQKITSAANPNRTPSSGLETANQKGKSQPGVLTVAFIFTLFSQAFEDRHFTERETSFGTLNSKLYLLGCASRLGANQRPEICSDQADQWAEHCKSQRDAGN